MPSRTAGASSALVRSSRSSSSRLFTLVEASPIRFRRFSRRLKPSAKRCGRHVEELPAPRTRSRSPRSRRHTVGRSLRVQEAGGTRVIATVLIVVALLAILLVLGLAVLAPVRPEIREKLLPAAPVLGAVLIAVVTNWSCRWLSIREALPVLALVVIALVVVGIRRKTRPFHVTRRALGGLGLGVAMSLGGLTLAAAPAAMVGDTNVVSPTQYFDQFYYAGVSTYITDHPLLPGPDVWSTDESADSPAVAPAADTVNHRLRFGQSAAGAVLSVLVGQEAFNTVTALGLVWLVLLGLSAAVAATILGLRTRWSMLAAALVTSSFYVVTVPLHGRSDGLLGGSIALLAIALSVATANRHGYSWPLVLVAAGLVSTYSELFIVVVPTVAGFVLIGPRATLLHRANRVAACWALSFILAPWAWIWMAQSFKTTNRLTAGAAPFIDKDGWALLRTYLGMPSFTELGLANAAVSVLAVVVLAAAVIGLAGALRDLDTRGLAVGFVVVFVGLEARAVVTSATYFQDRVMQLCMPFLLVLVVVGLTRCRPELMAPRLRRVVGRHGTWSIGVVAGLFIVSNLSTVALTTSAARVRDQHVPAAFTSQLVDVVEDVGAENVSVLAPALNDTQTIAMVLRRFPEVDFPVFPWVPSFLGSASRWDGEADEYYVVGPGAWVLGDVEVLVEQGEYKVVRLTESSMVAAPFLPTNWSRLLWRRGFPCAYDHSRVVVIRGSKRQEEIRVGSAVGRPGGAGLKVHDDRGRRLRIAGRTRQAGMWTVQAFELPRRRAAVLSLRRVVRDPDALTGTFPVVVGDGALDGTRLLPPDAGAADSCLRDTAGADGMDGYDRDIALMRTAW
ncbi:hypothetical protein QWY28_06990 [Nocardioides sp. SOB77]|uniref:Glycosyltransferase RgtA/B/C/D-like domain-containing protein n=1 Tax=Nocardioides oceani TaxID=3058369 RepID=A0ABT8FE35_9ACTN|nr:hypothetical protein [Nocardioides oceani]MDN4172680.1 hypothetical protein [Nocardioides oceani]